jgi:hypothetical protein
LLLSACGSNTPEIPPELLNPGTTPDGYPAGPHGTQVGDTVENASFVGWRDPQADDFDPVAVTTIEFRDYYDPDGTQGLKVLLLNTAAMWCQPCREEHETLPGHFAELSPRGFAVVSALFQNIDAEPATLNDMVNWTTTYDTNFPMVLDPDNQMGRYGATASPPLNLLVDPTDMTIIARFIGNQEAPLMDAIERELSSDD